MIIAYYDTLTLARRKGVRIANCIAVKMWSNLFYACFYASTAKQTSRDVYLYTTVHVYHTATHTTAHGNTCTPVLNLAGKTENKGKHKPSGNY